MSTSADPTVDALLNVTSADAVAPADYDVPADATFDNPDAVLAAAAATSGPNWLMIGGITAGAVVLVGGIAYVATKK